MSKIFTKVIVHTVSDFTKHYWLFKLSDFDQIKCLFNALLSLFLTAYHYSHRYQGQCRRRLPNLNVPYFEWHWMFSLDIYMSASNLKPARFSSSGYPFGAAPPGFQPGLVAWRNSLSSIPPTFPFTVCEPWPSARGMVLVALTAEYQECLKVGPFDVNYSRISACWRCGCSTRMRCVDTFCWQITYLPLQRRCVECSSFIIFL